MSGTATMAPGDVSSPHRELTRVDTVFLLISAMVVVDTIGAVAIAGGEAFTWLVVLFVTFFVPSALISAELGAAMPEQGGVYVWVRRAFGRFPAALTSLLYWAGTPMWLGGSITAIALSVHEQFVGDLGPGGRYVFAALFIGVATFAAVVPLRFGKWVPSSGAIGQTVLLGFFTVTVTIYGVSRGIHGIAVGDLSPSTAGFIAVAPILLYSFVGIELPTAAAGEMRNPRRDIPASIGRAGLAQALMYGIPVLAVLIVLPSEQISSLRGLLDAMRTVFSVYGGTVEADGTVVLTGAGRVIGTVTGLVFIWVLLASGSAWIIGAGRAQAAACLDGAGPRVFGRTSTRSGVPVIMGWATGLVALVVAIVSLAVTSGDGQAYFSATLTTSISLIVLAYLMIYPAFLALRHAEPGLDRPFRVPGGALGATVATVLATGWSLLTATCLLWPGFGTADPDRHLPAAFTGERARFEVLVIAPVVVVIVAAAAFAGRESRRVHAR